MFTLRLHVSSSALWLTFRDDVQEILIYINQQVNFLIWHNL